MTSTTTTIDTGDMNWLIWVAINKGLKTHGFHGYAAPAIALARKYWQSVGLYWQRKIISDVQVALELNVLSPLSHRLDWELFVKDLEPPKAAHTVDYRCHKCKRGNLKLWRPMYGQLDEHGLLCAACLAPDVTVDSHGNYDSSDQVNCWLPAVPVDDKYWEYGSVPSADVRWWRDLPTYAPSDDAISVQDSTSVIVVRGT